MSAGPPNTQCCFRLVSQLLQRTIKTASRLHHRPRSFQEQFDACSSPLPCPKAVASTRIRHDTTGDRNILTALQHPVRNPYHSLHPRPSILSTNTKIFSEDQILSSTPPWRNFVALYSQKHTDGRKDPNLSQVEVEAIFGQELDKKRAVDLLLKIQEQRRQGTLDKELEYPPELVAKGLEYLRSKYVVDEDAAIIARVDREVDGQWNLPQRNQERSRTSHSGLEEIRRINREKYAAEKAARDVKEEQLKKKLADKREQSKAITPISKKKNEVQADDGRVHRPGQRPMSPKIAQYYDDATEKSIPQMTKFQRLFPSTVFTVVVVALALLFAEVYTPPSADGRIFPNMPPAAAAVSLILGINIVIFGLWRVPPLWKSMNKYFMLVPAIPRPFSLLGAEFSHQEFLHLLSNVIGIWFVGTSCTPFCSLRIRSNAVESNNAYSAR